MEARIAALAAAALAGAGCGQAAGERDPPALHDASVDLPPVAECAGLDCLPCAMGDHCADAAEHLDGTCCAEGDPLVHLSSGRGAEVVDTQSDGRYAILCGGFGARISDVSDPAAPVFVGGATQRCQRAAFGPRLADGAQVIYLAHHGDTWVEAPLLATWRIEPDGTLTELAAITEPGVLYEGMAWRGGVLYVAAHGGGLRAYGTDAAGVPTFATALDGFTNAWTLALDGELAYVADTDAGVRIISLAVPLSPVHAGAIETRGRARHVAVAEGRLFVALGGSGVDVFDVTEPTAPVRVDTIALPGSAQAVAVDGGLLAVAAWSHVAVYDSDRLLLLGTERLRDAGRSQVLGIAVSGDLVFAGEWEGLHVLRHRPGFVAPDLWIDDDLYQFARFDLDARVVIARNRGRLPLVIDDIATTHASFSVDRESLALGAGAADYTELTYLPPGPPPGEHHLELSSNDPDPAEALYRIPLLADNRPGIDVGESLSTDFAMLDPTGAGQLSGLKGHVVVLAYFALF